MSKQYKDCHFFEPEIDIHRLKKMRSGILRHSTSKNINLKKYGIKYLTFSHPLDGMGFDESNILTNCDLNFDLIPEHPFKLIEEGEDADFEPPIENTDVNNTPYILDSQLLLPQKSRTFASKNPFIGYKYIKYVCKLRLKRSFGEINFLSIVPRWKRAPMKNMFKSIVNLDMANLVKGSNSYGSIRGLEINSFQLKELRIAHSTVDVYKNFASLASFEICLSCIDFNIQGLYKSVVSNLPLMTGLRSFTINIKENKVHQPKEIEKICLQNVLSSIAKLKNIAELNYHIQNLLLSDLLIISLASSFEQYNSLRSLKLEFINCFEDKSTGFNELARSITSNQSIKSLDFNFQGMPRFTYLDEFVNNLSYLPSLNKASFKFDIRKMTPKAWKQFLIYLSNHQELKELDLVFYDSNRELDFLLLAESLSFLKDLSSLGVKFERNKLCNDELIVNLGKSISGLEKLKHVIFEAKNNDLLSDEGMRDFCFYLRESKSLDNVLMNLEGCDISILGVYEFYAILPILTISSMEV